ncbi:hypothetical protein TCAL_16522 [Tigriopus californicus]|uniref:Uncharacterized protein n=1 Tax=Tigriopus californicus TaxID=6832 RepID=A0A553NUZ9_TIGCA|nr:hypothetical protein TCAL_16522 [Tigriopus californicus]
MGFKQAEPAIFDNVYNNFTSAELKFHELHRVRIRADLAAKKRLDYIPNLSSLALRREDPAGSKLEI